MFGTDPCPVNRMFCSIVAFFESGAQIILQIYIICATRNIKASSITFSLIILAKTTIMYDMLYDKMETAKKNPSVKPWNIFSLYYLCTLFSPIVTNPFDICLVLSTSGVGPTVGNTKLGLFPEPAWHHVLVMTILPTHTKTWCQPKAASGNKAKFVTKTVLVF